MEIVVFQGIECKVLDGTKDFIESGLFRKLDENDIKKFRNDAKRSVYINFELKNIHHPIFQDAYIREKLNVHN